MGLFDLFRSKSKNEKYGHLQSLVALALSDGEISEVEKAAIDLVCQREGLTPSDLKKAISELKPNTEHVFPSDAETKIRYLMDMVALMMVDGDINANELVLCKVCARAMGYREEVIDAMIQDIINDMK
jgi:uncharacterized tellurite resistance protein B-like protein